MYIQILQGTQQMNFVFLFDGSTILEQQNRRILQDHCKRQVKSLS